MNNRYSASLRGQWTRQPDLVVRGELCLDEEVAGGGAVDVGCLICVVGLAGSVDVMIGVVSSVASLVDGRLSSR